MRIKGDERPKDLKTIPTEIQRVSKEPLRTLGFVSDDLAIEPLEHGLKIGPMTATYHDLKYSAPAITVPGGEMPCFVVALPKTKGEMALLMNHDGGLLVLAYFVCDGGVVRGWAR